MISHKYKCIFIHIPKCAGSSIFKYLSDDISVDWKTPNYDVLYGWCPKRKIHLQHATARQLLDTELISKKDWENYTKFTVVRNPWDRALSDFLWLQQDINIKGSFSDFINKKGSFLKILNDSSNKYYRGDHLLNQTDFFDLNGKYSVDKIIRFEFLNRDLNHFFKNLNIEKPFINIHEKKSKKRWTHYSHFYTKSKRVLVGKKYGKDLKVLGYSFEDTKTGLQLVKNYI